MEDFGVKQSLVIGKEKLDAFLKVYLEANSNDPVTEEMLGQFYDIGDIHLTRFVIFKNFFKIETPFAPFVLEVKNPRDEGDYVTYVESLAKALAEFLEVPQYGPEIMGCLYKNGLTGRMEGGLMFFNPLTESSSVFDQPE